MTFLKRECWDFGSDEIDGNEPVCYNPLNRYRNLLLCKANFWKRE